MRVTDNKRSEERANVLRTGNQTSFDTKIITSARRKSKLTRDYAADKLRLLRLHAGIRFNDLGRLVAYRRRHRLAIGSEHGWAAVLANLAECFGQSCDVEVINEYSTRLGLPYIDADIAAAACRSAGGILMPAAVAGDFLEISSCERSDAVIRSLEAIDESALERRRRLSRDRQRKRRSVTRPYKEIMERDTRRRTASPALRAFRSSCSIRLPVWQEPQPSASPIGGGKGRPTVRPVRPLAEHMSRRDLAGSKILTLGEPMRFLAGATVDCCSLVLRVNSDAAVSEIKAAYRKLAKEAHSDAGGSDIAMSSLNVARDQAIKERSAK